MPNPAQQRRHSVPPPPQQPELVSPAFLLKALAAVFVVALIFAYITLCVTWQHTQWQLVLHPSRTLTAKPEDFALQAREIRFGVDASGQPQLDGWLIPYDEAGAPMALLLHDGSGTMSDALPAAAALHNQHFNVLLFDYRGFGKSAGMHPTQAMMQEDAESAFNYLPETGKAYSGGLVVYGIGLGGSVAAELARNHPQIAAVILQDPTGDTRQQVVRDVRSHIVPVSRLFHEDFPLAEPLRSLSTPKLLILHTGGSEPVLFKQAASPKMTVELPSSDASALEDALSRFKDSYLH